MRSPTLVRSRRRRWSGSGPALPTSAVCRWVLEYPSVPPRPMTCLSIAWSSGCSEMTDVRMPDVHRREDSLGARRAGAEASLIEAASEEPGRKLRIDGRERAAHDDRDDHEQPPSDSRKTPGAHLRRSGDAVRGVDSRRRARAGGVTVSERVADLCGCSAATSSRRRNVLRSRRSRAETGGARLVLRAPVGR